MYAVTVGKLKRFDCLYFDHNPPSFIFSVVQEEDSIYPSVYRLQFASPFITKHVTSRIILEFGGKINNLLAECMYQEVGGSLIEKIFACFLLQGLQLRKICSITGRKLESTRPLMDTLPDLTINFANCEIMNYSILTRDLRSIISDGLRTNKLLLQIQVNASCVDAVFYDGQSQKCYFIKITISINYPFNYLNVSDLAESLGINDHNLIDFVYLVPKDAFYKYRIQYVENAPLRNDYGFKQHVFFVPDIDNISFSIRD